MNKKRIIRVSFVLLLLTSLVLAYAYGPQLINKSHSAVPAIVVDPGVENNDDQAEDTGTPTGEDPWEEMDKLVNSYYGEKGIEYKGTVKLIDDNGDAEKVLEIHPFEYSFFNGSFYYLIDSMEVVDQENHILVADYRGKMISLADGQSQSPGRLFDMEKFRKMMQEQHVHAEVTQSGDQKMLTIDSIQDSQVQAYRIYYDPQTYNINKMLIGVVRFSPLDETEGQSDAEKAILPGLTQNNESSENPDGPIDFYTYYVEIVYTQKRLLADKNEYLPIKKFLEINNNRVRLQPGYSNFQLINLTGMEEDE